MIFVLDSKGVTELMKSPEMSGVIADACQRVAGVAESGSGLDFEASVQPGKSRAQGRVRPKGAKAYYKTLDSNLLQKALGSVKL